MDSTSSVQTLINRFELMAQANAAAPRSWSVAGSKRLELPPQPKSDNSLAKEIINTRGTRTQSEPAGMTQKVEEALDVAEPAEEEPPQEEAPVAVPETPTKPAVYKSLTVNTLESDDEDTTTALNFYEDESDSDSTTVTKSTCYSAIPPSPSSYSTASTGSLDSLLSSLDIFLPDLLHASGETSVKVSKLIKPTVHRSRRSSLPENLQSAKTSKLVPPTSYRRASLTGKASSTTTKDKVPSAPKSRRSSLYAATNPPPTPARPRRSSLSATEAPPPRHFSESAQGVPSVVTSPRSRSKSASAPRYMDYASSPRFAATKARNLERRRQLEERNRNLAADKTKHLCNKTARRARSPEWHGRLDQVRSRLFDPKKDNQSHTAKTKATTSRRHTTPARV